MNVRALIFSSVALLGFTMAAQAADLTYDLTGSLTPSGSFTGSFLINNTPGPTTYEFIDGGTFTVTAPSGGATYSFVGTGPDSTIPGQAFFVDTSTPADHFRLALNGTLSTLAVNTLAGIGSTFDTALILGSGVQFDATGGTVSGPVSAATPEPSSLILLGTGALGFAGAMRRRLLA